MGLCNFRKRNEKQVVENPRTPEEVVQQDLSAQGIKADTAEIAEVIKRLWNSIDFKPVFRSR